MEPRYQEILDFWFSPQADRKLWFGADEATDRLVREKFLIDLDDAVAGKFKAWEDKPESAIALIVLLDQFSLQLYREEKRSYEQSALAIPIAERAIERGFEEQLTTSQKCFLYMPFMHAENLKLQNKGVDLFSKLLEKAPSKEKKMVRDFLKFAKIHRDIVKEYGRFPGRNECYGRKNTPEEEVYIKNGGYF